MRLVKYDFSNYIRNKDVIEKIERFRPAGEKSFYALHPEEGGPNEGAPVKEEITLDDLLQKKDEDGIRVDIWASDAKAADDLDIDKYKKSLVFIEKEEDLPLYEYLIDFPCPCGCGMKDQVKSVLTEIFIISWMDCPVCNEHHSYDGNVCHSCDAEKELVELLLD